LNAVIRGKADVVDALIVALVAEGSVLLEDVPGVGKTTIAKTLAAAVDLKFERVQCTPDLLPGDFSGFSIFNQQSGSFQFRRGPLFTNLLLVDEINRASPRTQSALLESMAERQVTVDGQHHRLDPPFMVLATQNPLGFHGTFPLPEAQLDRFLFQLSLDYPDAESEIDILVDQMQREKMNEAPPIVDRHDILAMQQSAREVRVDRSVVEYMVAIARRTRDDSRLRIGCSPRGTLMFYRAAQAWAFVAGRDFVLPDDAQSVAPLVLAHRIVSARGGDLSHALRREIIFDTMQQVAVPV
jgi:MoxR-like ATPase